MPSKEKSLVYQATVSTDADTYSYIGLTEHFFKQRFTNHNQSFRHEKYSNSTELSKLIWKLKNSKTNYNITWQILQSSIPYKIGGSKCDLCLSEKLHIINVSYPIINKRTELISKCRHKNKFTVIIAKVREVRENIKRNRLILRIIQLWCFHHYHIVISHNTI